MYVHTDSVFGTENCSAPPTKQSRNNSPQLGYWPQLQHQTHLCQSVLPCPVQYLCQQVSNPVRTTGSSMYVCVCVCLLLSVIFIFFCITWASLCSLLVYVFISFKNPPLCTVQVVSFTLLCEWFLIHSFLCVFLPARPIPVTWSLCSSCSCTTLPAGMTARERGLSEVSDEEVLLVGEEECCNSSCSACLWY